MIDLISPPKQGSKSLVGFSSPQKPNLLADKVLELYGTPCNLRYRKGNESIIKRTRTSHCKQPLTILNQ
jgi:hypothetical protein